MSSLPAKPRRKQQAAPPPALQPRTDTLWAAKLAHELNNALMAAQSNLDSLRLACGSLLAAAGHRKHGREASQSQAARWASEMPEMLDDMASSLAFIADVVASMREFSQPMHEAPECFDVLQAVHSAIKLAHVEWPEGTKIKILPARGAISARGNPQALRQVLLNLFRNAARAMRTAAAPHLLAIHAARHHGSRVVITVSDSGPGIPETNRPRVFDPFFTTEKKQGGAGLGLFISREIIKRMGGDLALGTAQESSGARSARTQAAACRGATFVITLPA